MIDAADDVLLGRPWVEVSLWQNKSRFCLLLDSESFHPPLIKGTSSVRELFLLRESKSKKWFKTAPGSILFWKTCSSECDGGKVTCHCPPHLLWSYRTLQVSVCTFDSFSLFITKRSLLNSRVFCLVLFGSSSPPRQMSWWSSRRLPQRRCSMCQIHRRWNWWCPRQLRCTPVLLWTAALEWIYLSIPPPSPVRDPRTVLISVHVVGAF